MKPAEEQRQRFPNFVVSDLINRTGTAVTSVALPLVALRQLGAEPVEVGLLVAVGAAVNLVLGLPAGVMVDRLDARRLLIGCDVAQMAILASVPVAAWTHVLPA